MKTSIQFVHMATSEAMEQYVTEKINRLYKKYDWIVHTAISFKKENDPKGEGKICTIESAVPGPDVFASSNEKNFELAFKNSLADIEKQLEKRKQQMKSHI